MRRDTHISLYIVRLYFGKLIIGLCVTLAVQSSKQHCLRDDCVLHLAVDKASIQSHIA